MSYNTGDVVRYTGKFLRRIKWSTDVPINGLVLESTPDRSIVHWCDEPDDCVSILVSNTNLELCPRPKVAISKETLQAIAQDFCEHYHNASGE